MSPRRCATRPQGTGLNAETGEYEDLLKAGVADPVKVTRSALQNAASIAALFLTTEAVVADKPEKAPPQRATRPAAWAAWTSKSLTKKPGPLAGRAFFVRVDGLCRRVAHQRVCGFIRDTPWRRIRSHTRGGEGIPRPQVRS